VQGCCLRPPGIQTAPAPFFQPTRLTFLPRGAHGSIPPFMLLRVDLSRISFLSRIFVRSAARVMDLLPIPNLPPEMFCGGWSFSFAEAFLLRSLFPLFSTPFHTVGFFSPPHISLNPLILSGFQRRSLNPPHPFRPVHGFLYVEVLSSLHDL